MDRLFFDTNVLIDVGARRTPHYVDALEMLARVNEGKVMGGLSAISLSNMVDVMRTLNGVNQGAFFRELRRVLAVAPLGQVEVDVALKQGLPDFEDGLQWAAASAWNATHLVTGNVKDFPVKRGLKVLTPATYLAKR